MFGELEDFDGESFKGQYVLFFFYPADFSHVCTAELLSFEDRLDEFLIIDCAFVGINCDTEMVHLKWTETPVDQGGLGPIRFPLLADPTGDFARCCGVWNESSGCASRGSFIVDDEGIVRHVAVFDIAVGRNVTEHLRIVKALKFSDRYKSGCRLDWRPKDPNDFISAEEKHQGAALYTEERPEEEAEVEDNDEEEESGEDGELFNEPEDNGSEGSQDSSNDTV